MVPLLASGPTLAQNDLVFSWVPKTLFPKTVTFPGVGLGSQRVFLGDTSQPVTGAPGAHVLARGTGSLRGTFSVACSLTTFLEGHPCRQKDRHIRDQTVRRMQGSDLKSENRAGALRAP